MRSSAELPEDEKAHVISCTSFTNIFFSLIKKKINFVIRHESTEKWICQVLKS